MILFCQVLGIVISITVIILTVLWLIKFPEKVRKLSEKVNTINNETYEIERSKGFFKSIVKLFLINFIACLISVTVFIVSIVLSDGIPFHPAPLIILLCGGLCLAIALDLFIQKIGNKNQIKVVNNFDKNLYPIGFSSVAITSICVIIGFCFAEIIACAIYMLLLIF